MRPTVYDWGYPPEFLEEEKRYLGIAPELPQEPPQPKTSQFNALKDRLDSIQGEVRHAVNKINEHIDKSKKKGSAF